MLIGDLIVNLSLKYFSPKELVSQEGDEGAGLGVWAKELGWEVGFQEEQIRGGAWVRVKVGWGMKSKEHCDPIDGV